MAHLSVLFVIAMLGYVIGRIQVRGVSLGTSGVLLAALVFGHYGHEVPTVLRDLGLAMFVGAVGLIAGPRFFRNFRERGIWFGLLALVIVGSGAVITYILEKLLHIPRPLAVGVFTGAMTSTPGLAAGLEATGDPITSVGYGLAYPYGVLGVVLFVQVLPIMLGKDLRKEAAIRGEAGVRTGVVVPSGHLLDKGRDKGQEAPSESNNMLVFTAVLGLGLLLARGGIPLPGGQRMTLGLAGGPLFAGLIAGHLGRIGGISCRIPAANLRIIREFGLMLFLAGAGTAAGKGFVEVLMKYGWALFATGAAVTTLPMILGFLVASRVVKLDLISNLSAICGGMTSTPALGALVSAAGSDEAAASYAATYPFALVIVILCSQALAHL